MILFALFSPFHALNYLQRNKKLYWGLLGPVTVSVLVLMGTFWLLSGWIHSTMAIGNPVLELPDWLVTGLELLLKILALSLLSILTVPLAALFSFPFTDWITRTVLPSKAALPIIASFQMKLVLQEGLRSVLALVVILGGMIGGFLVNTFPAGIVLAPFIALFAGAASLSIQFLTYPLALQGHGVRTSLGWLVTHWPITLAFGMVHTFLFSIPILLPVMIPMTTLAAALIHLKLRMASER